MKFFTYIILGFLVLGLAFSDEKNSSGVITPQPLISTTIPSTSTNHTTDPTSQPPPTTPSTPKTTSATSTTAVTPSTNASTTTTTSKPTTSSSTTTVSPITTTSTPSPPTTSHPSSTPSPPTPSGRKFDLPSFIGGFVLAAGLVAIGVISWKFYLSRQENFYHTL